MVFDMTLRDGSRSSLVAVRSENLERRRQRAFVLVTLFMAVGFVAVMCSDALGQNYQALKINPALEAPKTMKRMENAAKAYAQARDLSTVKDANVAGYYYAKYVPAKITQPDSIADISELMDSVRTRMTAAQRSRAPGARQIMIWLYTGLKPIAQGNFHPSARISAILFISRMDTKPANFSQKTPPEPLSRIPIDFMPIYLDAKAPEGVRAAALQGLHRYVTYAGPKVPAAISGQLATEMKKLLSSDPPAGRSEDVHAYLQRFAVDILAGLGASADPELGKTLVSISTEPKKHDLIALHSAARIGSMSKELQGKVDSTDKVLNSWAVRAMRSFQYEIARINAFERPKAVSGQPRTPDSYASTKKEEKKATPSMSMEMEMGMGDMDMGDMEMEMMDDGGMDDMMGMEMEMGMGMGMSGVVQHNPQPPEVLTSRRKLNHVLQQLHMGVSGSGTRGQPKSPGGLLAAVGPAEQPLIQNWLTKMEEVVTALNDPALDTLEKYTEALDAQVTALEAIAGAEAVAAVADLAIKLPGVTRVVATKPTVNQSPEAPQLDASGAPQFPAGDELASPE